MTILQLPLRLAGEAGQRRSTRAAEGVRLDRTGVVDGNAQMKGVVSSGSSSRYVLPTSRMRDDRE